MKEEREREREGGRENVKKSRCVFRENRDPSCFAGRERERGREKGREKGRGRGRGRERKGGREG